MSYMFYGCSGILELDTDEFDTSQATTMEGMFGGCVSLWYIDLTSFDVSKVSEEEDWSRFIEGCNSNSLIAILFWDPMDKEIEKEIYSGLE